MRKLNILGNERGGVEVMIFTLIALLFSILVMVFCLDYIILYNSQNKLKNDLNAEVHAGSIVYRRNPAFRRVFQTRHNDAGYAGAGYVL